MTVERQRRGAPDTGDFVRPLVLDGAWSKGMEAITSGVVLAGLALYLGAGPVMIGLVAATPFFAQFAQFAGLRIVFVSRDRRKVSLAAALAARLLLGGIGFVALAGPSPWAIPALLVLLSLSGALSAIFAVSFSFWMRDLIPRHVYGTSFSQRFFAQAIVSVVLTLAGGAALSYAMGAGLPGIGFALLFFAGSAFGIVSLIFAARLPDVPLNPLDTPPNPLTLLRAVAAHRDRRDVVHFVLAWTSASFLAVPFVTVFLLRDIGLDFTLVALYTALAMVASLVTFRFWGRSVDRHGTRAVLALAIPGAALAMVILPFAAGRGGWHYGLLGAVFFVNGAAFAAVDVAVAKLIARKAPFTGAGTFLAGTGIVRALAAGGATILGGLAARALAGQELRLTISLGPAASAGAVSGYALLFVVSALLMLYAWHRVLGLRDDENGDVRDVLHEAQVELTGLAPFRGVRIVGAFAGHVATHVFERRHNDEITDRNAPHREALLAPSQGSRSPDGSAWAHRDPR